MKLLIDIGHSAHVNLFKNLAFVLISKGWKVLFSVRQKGENVDLLKSYGLPYITYGATSKSNFGKIFTVFRKTSSLTHIVKTFQPTITVSHSSFYLSQVSWYCNIPNITLEDTGNMEQVLLYLPFTNAILTPLTYHRNHGKRQIRYNGFHETAYIHPSFQKQEPTNDLSSAETVLIRLVDWTASHDLGHKGLSTSTINQLFKLIGDQTKIKILSEKPLPENLKQYALNIPPHQLQEFLTKVKLYIGEGATLASECALMGIPAIYVNSRSAGVIDEKVKAGLMYHFKTNEGVLEKTMELLFDPDTHVKHKNRAEQYLKGQINLSKFLTWFVEEWPKSFQVMKQNPDYQYNFR